MALAATGMLGLLFGWAVRGLRLRGRLRKSEGERNIALGSLSEKEAELEALYAAGRAPVSGEDAASAPASNEQDLRAEIAERDEVLQSLNDELARSKAEINELRSNQDSTGRSDISATAVGSAVAGMAAGAMLSKGEERLDANLDKEEASLEWRNRYLESRVRSLEEKIKEASAEAPQAAEIVAPASEMDTQPSDSDAGLEKLKWQNDYLKQRLEFFENQGAPSKSETAATSSPEDGDEKAGIGDEEIASLRWRNRQLERRLAYYEGDKAIAGGDEPNVAYAPDAALVASQDFAESEDAAPIEETAELDVDAGVEEATPPVEAEAMPEEIQAPASQEPEEVQRGEKPIALDGPVGGEGDDLTAIGGIGPKIQEVLNGFGIFHYDQIAAWTAENVEWVDGHLAFEGRIEREQWVQQADALSNVD